MTHARLSFTNVCPPEKFTFSTPASWAQWRKRFERFMSVSGYDSRPENEKIDMLVYIMGEEAEEILIQFKCQPETYVRESIRIIRSTVYTKEKCDFREIQV